MVYSISELTWAKTAKNAPYVKLVLKDEQGKSVKCSAFPREENPKLPHAVEECFQQGLWIDPDLETKGSYTNLVAFEAVSERIDKLPTPPPPDESLIEESAGGKVAQTPPAPQAVGMITKEIGDHIRAKTLKEIFGVKIGWELIKWYRAQTLGITRINYDGEDLPTFTKDEK